MIASQHDDTPFTAAELAAGELLAELSRADEAATAVPESLAQRLAATRTPALRALPTAAPRRRGIAAWVIAAAATLAWFLLPSPLRRDGQAPARDFVALADSLASDLRVMRVAWAASTDPAAREARGEVLWDAGAQRGVMRFVGLVPNDPRVAQYQLWIVDAERDARYPVDGGVFDVTSSGEIIVPINARLPVSRPTLFAVTLEVPGGVVVSNRDRLVLAAPVEG